MANDLNVRFGLCSSTALSATSVHSFGAAAHWLQRPNVLRVPDKLDHLATVNRDSVEIVATSVSTDVKIGDRLTLFFSELEAQFCLRRLSWNMINAKGIGRKLADSWF